MQAIPSLVFDNEANAAVRENNEDIRTRAEDAPAEGGNIAKLDQKTGSSRRAKAKEASFFKYQGSSAEELVSILLVKDFDKFAELKKAEANATKEESKAGQNTEIQYESPLIDPEVKTIGISNKGHPKCLNTIQILYVYGIINQVL
jgi:hypothetical protein